MLSRRTNDSSPLRRLFTNVPLVLWSMSTNLPRESSMRACRREIRLPLTTKSFSSARPMVMCCRDSSTTTSRSVTQPQARRPCGPAATHDAICGSMLVTSSGCQITSNSVTSAPCPRSVATSIWRTAARQSGDSCSTVAAVVMICPALAWLVMRFAVCTVAPKTSRLSSTTGPKWHPTRIATADHRSSALASCPWS
jgi:hypothetical protein